MTVDRTEDAGLAGVLPITIGGLVRYVPALKIRQSREWKAKLGELVAGIDIDDDLGRTIATLANLASDRALDLVEAYDTTGALGGREAIEDQATDVELFAALEVIVKATYPFEGALRSAAEAFGPQIRRLVEEALGRVADALSRVSSTPTRSVSGDSTPTPLSSGSVTSSSSSSGPTTNGALSTEDAMSVTSSPTG